MNRFSEMMIKLRKDRSMSRRYVGEKVGVDSETILRLEKRRSPPAGDTYRKVLELYGTTPEKQLRVWRDSGEPLDNNAEPYSRVEVSDIPTFDLPVAAGPWMELPEVLEDDERQKLAHKTGRFRIRIRGDSMEKKYPDGSLIEFCCLRVEAEDDPRSKMIVGADYYIQKASAATFKRLESFDDGVLVFRALNRKKYPAKIEVLRDDLVQMSKAEFILVKAS
jgi:transcriptional regulator with XRE-family HTH domain